MHALSIDEHDVVELNDLLKLVHDDSGPALPWPFLHRLKQLIGCDELSFNGLDSVIEAHYLTQAIDDDESFDARPFQRHPEDEPFWQHYWSTDCSYPDVSGDYTNVTLQSDFYSATQWHSTGMYADYSNGIEHELMMCLPDGPGRSLRLLAFRGPGADFGERERFLLTLLRPHIGEAYRETVRCRSAPAELTPRQRQILELVRLGYTNHQVARRMRISEGTVRTHLANIFSRLEVTSRTAAVTRAFTHTH